jgi:hypothetical protein
MKDHDLYWFYNHSSLKLEITRGWRTVTLPPGEETGFFLKGPYDPDLRIRRPKQIWQPFPAHRNKLTIYRNLS